MDVLHWQTETNEERINAAIASKSFEQWTDEQMMDSKRANAAKKVYS
jgi:hypothetical protein